MPTDRNIKELLSDPAKRSAWVGFQLKLKGESFATIGRRAGVTRQAVRQAMYKQNPRMELIIADILDMRAADLFPERYDAAGQPIRCSLGRPKKLIVKCSSFSVHRNSKIGKKTTKPENTNYTGNETVDILSAPSPFCSMNEQ